MFEIDQFLTEMAIDYLNASVDHILNAMNFYMYKQQSNGKWIYLSHDFDLDIGQYEEESYNLTFKEFTYKYHIIDVLILQEPSRFNEILKDVVNRVFNPSTLYPHIDELKQFIKPYVELDKTVDSEGNYPGKINTEGYDTLYSMEQWDAYSEFTAGLSDRYSYGIKYWILMEYRNVCKIYNMECEEEYIDENYEYTVVEDLEYKPGYGYYGYTTDYYDHNNDYYTTDYYYPDSEYTESFSEDELLNEVEIPTTYYEDDESSTEDEEEDEVLTDSVESSNSIPKTVSASTKITITKTKVSFYTTTIN